MVNHAHCLKYSGNEAGYVAGLLAAYNFRPRRAEPLHDLANHYRVKGQNFPALMAAEEGMRIPRPNDMLFVRDDTYETGLRQEFAITAYYDPARRDRGAAICNDLMLGLKVPDHVRAEAKANMFYYIKSLAEHMPSFVTRHIAFTPPNDYVPMNPSIITVDTILGPQIFVNVRAVNYTMDEEGRYLIKGTNGEANGTNPIHTRNFLLTLNDDFSVHATNEILPPEGFPPPTFNLVVGFEDMRLFVRGGDIWTLSNVRDQNPEGWCEQIMAKLGPDNRLTDYQFIRPSAAATRKKLDANYPG